MAEIVLRLGEGNLLSSVPVGCDQRNLKEMHTVLFKETRVTSTIYGLFIEVLVVEFGFIQLGYYSSLVHRFLYLNIFHLHNRYKKKYVDLFVNYVKLGLTYRGFSY